MGFKVICGYIIAFILLALLPITACYCVPKQVSLDESYNGQKISIADGGVLILTLKATSCSDWKLINISDLSVVELMEKKVELPETDNKDIVFSPICGPERDVIWSFKAVKRGNCVLRLGLVTDDGLAYTLKDFSLSVIVR